MTEQQSPSIENLIATAELVRYCGEYLLQGTVRGDEAERHAQAIKLVESQFVAIDAEIKAHPDYQARLEQVANQKAAQEARMAEVRRATAAAQPKVSEPARA